ncbi:SIMPL domain-containing protein [Afipia sp. DC4300-2b1]|uniref:SIMPL domain-containing protein n=1 Tax=Afipia sp. DC4300-2b1 TaxID=2804672 RepID=UPI003CF60090
MRARTVIAAIAIATMASSAFGQSLPPTVSVTGEASITVPPDLAQIDSGVTTEAKTAREASEANNKAMGGVLQALKNAGIAEKDIQTSRLSLSPQSTPGRNPNAPFQITGYRASNRVTVTIRDIAKVADTIDVLVGSGANEISGISFMVSKASKLLDDARSEAIADARRKAEIYAKAANISLGAPISISEETAPGPVPYRKMAADIAASAPVAQGQETLRVSVSVSYELKPKAQ